MSNAPKSHKTSLAESVVQILSRVPVQKLLSLKFNFNLEMSSGWIVLIVILALIIGATF